MKDSILNFLRTHRPKRYDVKSLAKALDMQGSDAYKVLAKAVIALEDETRIIADDKNRYALIEDTPYTTGVLDVKDKGFAFLAIDDSDDDDIYIPKQKLAGAMNRDHVLVKVHASKLGFKKEGEVTRILKRHATTLVGIVIKKRRHHYLLSDDYGRSQEIRIPDDKLAGAKLNDKVATSIIRYPGEQPMAVKVDVILGPVGAPGVDVLSKILKYNIDPVFPEAVTQAATQFGRVTDKHLKNRTDLRHRRIVTIDGDDAKDFDDAVDITETEKGYVLGVHIADVAHYVQEDSILDKEARHRGTSIYLVDRVIPMLPEALSNDLCSLKPGQDRLTLTCEMHIDRKGTLQKTHLYESVIRSMRRLTYHETNLALEGDSDTCKKLGDLTDDLKRLKALAKILYDKRTRDGSIHFETEEPVVTLNEQGEAIAVELRPRGISEGIIEECMLIANQAVARFARQKRWPFIFRIHDVPKEEKLEKLLAMAHGLGFDVPRTELGFNHTALQKLLQEVENTASEKGVNLVMLRSMQKAVYSTDSIGHFGLAFKDYTHFTSPIRRYPDLLVHRLLKQFLFKREPDAKHDAKTARLLPELARHSSARERTAVDLEREVLDMKKAEYMSRYIGKTYTGTISSVTPFGLYVSLPNTVEGLIHISELIDDYYRFNEELLLLIGQNTRKTYRIGDRVKVKLTDVNIFDAEIDFTLIKEAS
ncbi:MAG: ribonuclease R [Acholeplasmatales bacterium]|nr:MAG: ribonuclease R [Acholeplasmatales bacterium]